MKIVVQCNLLVSVYLSFFYRSRNQELVPLFLLLGTKRRYRIKFHRNYVDSYQFNSYLIKNAKRELHRSLCLIDVENSPRLKIRTILAGVAPALRAGFGFGFCRRDRCAEWTRIDPLQREWGVATESPSPLLGILAYSSLKTRTFKGCHVAPRNHRNSNTAKTQYCKYQYR